MLPAVAMRVQLSMAAFPEHCLADAEATSVGSISWPQTNIGKTSVVRCPNGGKGNASRYCDSSPNWWKKSNVTQCLVETTVSQRQFTTSLPTVSPIGKTTTTIMIEHCLADTEETSVGSISWPQTNIGKTSVVRCPNGGKGNASRYCDSYPKLWKKSDVTQCSTIAGPTVSPIVKETETKVKDAISKGNVVEASEIFNNMTKKLTKTDVSTQDLNSAMKTMGVLTRNISKIDTKTATSLTQSVSDLLDVKLEKEEEVSVKTGLKFIESIKNIEVNLKVTNNSNNVISAKMASFSCLRIRNNSKKYFQLSSNGGSLKAGDSSTADLDSSFAIVVPKSAAKNFTHMHFVFLNSTRFFAAAQKLNTSQRLSQQMLSASLGNYRVLNLVDPVFIKFTIPKNGSETIRPTCVFWDTEKKRMSEDGCNTTWREFENVITVNCTCNHLTNFALMMDYLDSAPLPVSVSTALSVLSYIGLSLSLLGLLLTLITYLHFRHLRKNLPGKILIRLCFTLLCANIVFVFGTLHKSNDIPCKVVGMLLHYLYVSVMLWSSVEAVQLFQAIVKVFNGHISRFLLKASLVAWGVPAVIVAITIGINIDNYSLKSEALCFLSHIPLICAFAVPIGVLMIANVVVFVLVIFKMRESTCKQQETMKRSSKQVTTVAQVRGSIGLCMLLGLTWVFGFFAVKEQVTQVIFHVLFISSHTMQGLSIFIVYCLLKNDVLLAWGKYFECFRRLSGQPTQTSTANAASSGLSKDKKGTGRPSMDQGTSMSAEQNLLTKDSQSTSLTYRSKDGTSENVEMKGLTSVKEG